MLRFGRKPPEPEPEPRRGYICAVCGSAEWYAYYVGGKDLCGACFRTMQRALPRDATRAMRLAYLAGLVQQWLVAA